MQELLLLDLLTLTILGDRIFKQRTRSASLTTVTTLVVSARGLHLPNYHSLKLYRAPPLTHTQRIPPFHPLFVSCTFTRAPYANTAAAGAGTAGEYDIKGQ